MLRLICAWPLIQYNADNWFCVYATCTQRLVSLSFCKIKANVEWTPRSRRVNAARTLISVDTECTPTSFCVNTAWTQSKHKASAHQTSASLNLNTNGTMTRHGLNADQTHTDVTLMVCAPSHNYGIDNWRQISYRRKWISVICDWTRIPAFVSVDKNIYPRQALSQLNQNLKQIVTKATGWL